MKTARQAKRRGTTRPPYARELHDIAVRALRAGRLPAELAREIGVPTTTLRAWLHAADLAAAGSRHTRTEVLGRAIREYARLDQLLARLSSRDFALRLPFDRSARDRWTVKDALAHITFWKADVARKALGIRRPAKDREAMSSDPNHFVYLQWRDRSAKDVVAWHGQVQEDLVAALRAAPAMWFTSKDPASWWPPNVDHHSAQHRRDIERALERARPR